MNTREYEDTVIALFRSGKATDAQWREMAGYIEVASGNIECCTEEIDAGVFGPRVACKHCGYKSWRGMECWECGEEMPPVETNEMTTRYARIRVGACVMQDHQFPLWPIVEGCEGVVFSVAKKGASFGYRCIADGYGMLAGGGYGNGAVSVRAEDLRWCTSSGEALAQ